MKPILAPVLLALSGLVAVEGALAQDFSLPPDLPSDKPPDLPPELPPDLPPELPADQVGKKGSDLASTSSSTFLDDFTLSAEGRAFLIEDIDGETLTLGRLTGGLLGRTLLGDTLSLLANVNTRAQLSEGESFDASEDIRLDTRELALSWEVQPSFVVEAGRVNIRSGVASGFNPTDRFRVDSLVVRDSLDIADRREDRLGVLVVDAAYELPQGLLQLGFVPEIDAGDDTVLTDADIVGLGLDRTNADNQLFVKYSPTLGGNLVATGSAYVQRRESGAGIELSAAASNALVVYGEAFVQRRRGLGGAAGATTGVDGDILARLDTEDGRSSIAQTAVGASWSLPSSLVGQEDVTLAFEHHYNGAGFDEGGLDALGEAPGFLAGPIFAEAARLQEPLARHSFFTRFAWTDVVDDVDVSAIGFVEPHQGSGQAQLSVDMQVNDQATLGFRAQTTWGDDDSAFGSNPVSSSLQLFYKMVF